MKTGGSQRRDVRLIVGAVALSAAGDFLLWIPLTLHLRALTESGFAVAALIAIAAGGVLIAAIGARTTVALAGIVPVAVGIVGLAVYLRSSSALPLAPEPARSSTGE